MIVLHGIYDNGKITITDSVMPDIKAEVKIIFRKKSWQRKTKRVKLNDKNILASNTVINIRNEI